MPRPTKCNVPAAALRCQLVVLKSSRWLLQCCWLDRFLRNRRLAGLGPAGKTLTKQADRTEFHCSREFIAAARQVRWGSLLMALTALLPQPEAEQSQVPPSGVKPAGVLCWQAVVELQL